MARHVAKTTQNRLDRVRDQIYAEVDGFALRLGGLLLEAKQLHPRGFIKWVESELPFSYDTARRLIAIHICYSELSESQLAALPRPWQALYAIRREIGPNLDQALESGEIGPDTTVDGAIRWSRRQREPLKPLHSTADLIAGRLMACDPEDLDPRVADELIRWLTPAARPLVARI